MLRIATIGTSMITSNLIDVLHQNEGAVFVGTCSRSTERAAAFTAQHGGSRSFTSVGELAACPEVDAVYIGSPNGLHASQALACIAGGKHVLVEKSFCANAHQAHQVFDAADAAGVVALEAMRPVHDPAFRACQEAMAQIGRIRRATLRFGKYSSRYDDLLAGRRTNIFDCALAGGALMDMGVYSVAALVEFFGEPDSIAAATVLLDESTRDLTNGPIDGAGTVLARYADMVASVHYSKISADLSDSQIEGEAGTLTIHGISCPDRARVEMREPASRNAAADAYSAIKTAGYDVELPLSSNTMCYELADFVEAVEAVNAGAAPADAPCGPYGTVGHFRATTLSALAIMDECRAQAGIVFPADTTA